MSAMCLDVLGVQALPISALGRSGPASWPKWAPGPNYPTSKLLLEGNCHEVALELASGANFGCVLHHFSGPTRLKGSRGQVRQEIRQKLDLFDFLAIPFLDLARCQKVQPRRLPARPATKIAKAFLGSPRLAGPSRGGFPGSFLIGGEKQGGLAEGG